MESSSFDMDAYLHKHLPVKSDNQFGFSIPGYEIRHLIKSGGQGSVYLATQLSLNRLVAIKILFDEPAAAIPDQKVTEASDKLQHHKVTARFRHLKDAELAGKLSNPHIVDVYHTGNVEPQGYPFIVMEYLPNGTLRDRLNKSLPENQLSPLPIKEVARILANVADGTGQAHRNRILHRDLKPENIMFDHDDVAKVVDFGLARELERTEQFTTPGNILGTPGYMSPEQFQANADVFPVTSASDVYSLGVILYECLHGRLPSSEKGWLSQAAIMRGEIDQAPFDKRIPRDLQAICRTCLYRDPQKRYASAAILADELKLFLDGKVLQQTLPFTGMEKAWRMVRRYPKLSMGIAATSVVVILIVGGLVWSLVLLNRVSKERDRANNNIASLVTVAKDLYSYYDDELLEGGRSDDARIDLMKKVIGKLDDVRDQLPSTDTCILELNLLNLVGIANYFKGNFAEARNAYRKHEEVVANKSIVHDTSLIKHRFVGTLGNLTVAYAENDEKGINEYTHKINTLLNEMRNRMHESLDMQLKLAQGYFTILQVLIYKKQYTQALSLAEERLKFHESINPPLTLKLLTQGMFQFHKGTALQLLNKHNDAIISLKASVDAYDKYLRATASKTLYIQALDQKIFAHSNLITIMSSLRSAEEVRKEMAAQIEDIKHILNISPRKSHMQLQLIHAITQYGSSLHKSGKLTEALKQADEAKDIMKEVLRRQGTDDKTKMTEAQLCHVRGDILLEKKDFELARGEYRQSNQIRAEGITREWYKLPFYTNYFNAYIVDIVNEAVCFEMSGNAISAIERLEFALREYDKYKGHINTPTMRSTIMGRIQTLKNAKK